MSSEMFTNADDIGSTSWSGDAVTHHWTNCELYKEEKEE